MTQEQEKILHTVKDLLSVQKTLDYNIKRLLDIQSRQLDAIDVLKKRVDKMFIKGVTNE